MDLEKRVQQLEQELVILKNQIQTTLLDIQEQLLTQTYPALRADDQQRPTVPDNTVYPAAPVSNYTPPPASEAAADPGTIKVRKVSLSDIAAPQPEAAPCQPEYEGGEVVDMAQYRRWVIEQLNETGVKRTRDLIKSYAQQGLLAPDVRDNLLQITMRYAASSEARPAAPPPASRPQRHSTEATNERTRPTRPSQNRAQVESTPKPARQRPAKTQPQPEPVIETEADEGSHNLVLRLIAGVQNAGAGVRWGKDKRG